MKDMEKEIYETPSALLIPVEASGNFLQITSGDIDKWEQEGYPINF